MFLKYLLFAFIAILANILSQKISLSVYNGPHSFYISILFGTLIGLILKFTLDKKYIFHYAYMKKNNTSKKFILYTTMSIFTTFIFWGLELIFDAVFRSELFRYIGAFLGLSIGYSVKYLLDKKYVFK
jgi:hypothetical protein